MLKLKAYLSRGCALRQRRCCSGAIVAGRRPDRTSCCSQIGKMKVGPHDWPQWGGSHPAITRRMGKTSPSAGMSTPVRTSAGRCRWARRLMATPSLPTARSMSAPITATATSSGIQAQSIWGACLLRREGREVPLAAFAVRNCRPVESTTGRIREFAALRTSMAIEHGMSAAVGMSSAWIRKDFHDGENDGP